MFAASAFVCGNKFWVKKNKNVSKIQGTEIKRLKQCEGRKD
jgi:hypothetical protein